MYSIRYQQHREEENQKEEYKRRQRRNVNLYDWLNYCVNIQYRTIITQRVCEGMDSVRIYFWFNYCYSRFYRTSYWIRNEAKRSEAKRRGEEKGRDYYLLLFNFFHIYIFLNLGLLKTIILIHVTYCMHESKKLAIVHRHCALRFALSYI